MAVFADLVAGEVHRPGGYVRQGISAIVSILSETLRHKKGTHSQKRQADDDENKGYPKEMPGIFEGIHKKLSSQIPQFVASPLCAGSQRGVFMATGRGDLRSECSRKTVPATNDPCPPRAYIWQLLDNGISLKCLSI